jgi:hypothetical protein
MLAENYLGMPSTLIMYQIFVSPKVYHAENCVSNASDNQLYYSQSVSNLCLLFSIIFYCIYRALFWTDWGIQPKIERCSMDGNNRRVLVRTSIYWPNGLTVDYAANKLFWTDAKHHVIETSNFDGSHRRTLVDRGNMQQSIITSC